MGHATNLCLDYQLAATDRRAIDAFARSQDSSLLVLTRHNDTARSFRGFFNRRLPLWEGHTRSALENLVDAITASRRRDLHERHWQRLQPVGIRRSI